MAVPFRSDDVPEWKAKTIIDGLLDFPIFPIPASLEERRVILGFVLTDPNSLVWEVWSGSTLIGVMTLDRIIPKLEARAHLIFFDHQLVGRRGIILKMMAWAFRELRLNRIDVEVPETVDTLVAFCRRLGFRYPGEAQASAHPTVRALERLRINNPANWVCKWGSRKEAAHWDGKQYVDVVCLRILRSEFEAARAAEAEKAAASAPVAQTNNRLETAGHGPPSPGDSIVNGVVVRAERNVAGQVA